MRYYEASSLIEAPPTTVWDVLADAAHWPRWDSGVTSVEGRLRLGEKVVIRSEAAPGRAFPVVVTAHDAPRQLELRGGLPAGLFRGVRTFALTATDDGRTGFRVREEYSGPLLPLIWRSMPDLQASFEQFAAGLKTRAEEVSSR